MNAQYLKIVARYFVAPDAPIASGPYAQVHRLETVAGQTREGGVAVSKVEIVRIGHVDAVSPGECPYVCRILNLRSAKQHALNKREHGCIRADAQAERQNGGSGEPGGLAERTNRIAHVSHQRVEESDPAGITHAFLMQFQLSYQALRSQAGLVARKSALYPVFHFLLKVMFQFRSRFPFDSAPRPNRPHSINQFRKPAHDDTPNLPLRAPTQWRLKGVASSLVRPRSACAPRRLTNSIWPFGCFPIPSNAL